MDISLLKRPAVSLKKKYSVWYPHCMAATATLLGPIAMRGVADRVRFWSAYDPRMRYRLESRHKLVDTTLTDFRTLLELYSVDLPSIEVIHSISVVSPKDECRRFTYMHGNVTFQSTNATNNQPKVFAYGVETIHALPRARKPGEFNRLLKCTLLK